MPWVYDPHSGGVKIPKRISNSIEPAPFGLRCARSAGKVNCIKKTNAISGLERHQYMEIYNISCSKTISPYISQSLFCVEGHIRPVLHLIDPHKLKIAFLLLLLELCP